MGNKIYNYEGKEYCFNKNKYICYFDRYKKSNHLSVDELNNLIADICKVNFETAKKWKCTKESGTTPSDFDSIEKLTELFELDCVADLLSKVEMEDNNLMNSLSERQAIKNVIKSFSRLAKVYLKTKTECDYRLLQIAVNNYNSFLTNENEDIVDCFVQFDGENYIYDAIANEADSMCNELVAESIDLPKEFMESVLMLIRQMVYEDEVEKGYMTEDDLKEIMKREQTYMPIEEIKVCKDSLIYGSASRYCKKFNEILEKYNISIRDYTYLMC